MNKLGIGTILAITGITLTIAGLIILPYAENSLAQVERQNEVVQSVNIELPELLIGTEKVVLSSSRGHFVSAAFTFQQFSPSFCFDGDPLQRGEVLWSIKKAKLNFDTRCGFVDITVEATSNPETIEEISDCSSSSTFRKRVTTFVEATFSGTVGGTSISGDNGLLMISSSITRSCP